MSEHDDLAPLVPAYAIGALDAAEHEAFVRHLAGCDRCTAEVREYTQVADAMARSVTQISPRPELRAQLLETLGRGQIPNHKSQITNPKSQGVSPRWALGVGLWDLRTAFQAALVVVAVALGVYTFSLRSRVEVLEARLDEASSLLATTERAMGEARAVAFQSQSAMSVLAAPDLARIDLVGQAAAPTASARALWSRQRGMVFAVQNLPALPAGRTYQVWVVTAAAPISAGLLEPDQAGRGIAVFATPPDIAAPVAIAVTIEPAGGVPAPTGARYLIGTPSA